MSSDDDDDERQFDEMEGHDMDNDFEGGQWVEDEYFYRSKRQKKAQTKDQRIYGIFASDDDDEDGGRRGGNGRTTDYLKPVAFKSAGAGASEGPHVGPDGYGVGVKMWKTQAQAQPGAHHGGPGLGATAGLGMSGGMSGLGFKKGGTVTSSDMDVDAVPSSSAAGLGSRPGKPGLGMGAAGMLDAGGGGGWGKSAGGRGGLGLGAGGAGDQAEEEGSDEELLPSTFGQRWVTPCLGPSP